jgi:hypothetical protein
MRTFKLALMTAVWAAAGTVTVAPAAAVLAAPSAGTAAVATPMPRPTTGGIRPTYCPADGYISVTASVQGGKTSVKVGDTVTLVVTMTAVYCDLMNTDFGLPPPGGRTIGPAPLTGGLKGSGVRDNFLEVPAGNVVNEKIVATAAQAGTWTYTAQAVGYSFGQIDPGTGSGCSADVAYGVGPGFKCPRSVQASVTINISGPASPTPASGSGGSQSGSSGSSQGQAGDGAAQATPGGLASSPSLAGFGTIRALGRTSIVSAPLLIALAAVMVLAMAGAGVVLIRRRLARGPGGGLEASGSPD